jgi:hypothetical protein
MVRMADSQKKWTVEWNSVDNGMVSAAVFYDGKPVVMSGLHDLSIGVDKVTGYPTLTLTVLAPGLEMKVRNVRAPRDEDSVV